MEGNGISTNDSLTIAAAVVALAGLVKWAVPDDKLSRMAILAVVFGLSALGVGLWLVSLPTMPTRVWIWGIFQAWLAVSLQAAGVYGVAAAGIKSARGE